MPLSRYKPHKITIPTSRLKARDIEILTLVYNYRFLDTELLDYLIKNDRGFGKSALYKRLQRLFHSLYLSRYYLTDQPIGRGYGGPRAIYGIGSKSIDILAEVTGHSKKAIRLVVDSNKIKSPYLRHALQVARFRVILDLACHQLQGQMKVLFWEQGQHLRDSVHDQDLRYSVYPDAFFGLQTSFNKRLHFFLEVDRGTMPIVATANRSDIRTKLIGYWHYKRKGMISRKYSYRMLPDGAVTGIQADQQSQQSAIRSFQVLFLLPGHEISQIRPNSRLGNIIGLLPELGKGFSSSNMFLFSTSKSIAIDRPETLFQPIWITANPGRGLQSLIPI